MAAVMAVFVYGIIYSARSAVGWAQKEIDVSAAHASQILEEPLRTQRFEKVLDTADAYLQKEIYLTIRHRERGGMFFDNRIGVKRGEEPPEHEFLSSGKYGAGDYTVMLSYRFGYVSRPLMKTLLLVVLALMLGIATMIFVFYAFYRERARSRENERRLNDLAALDRERRNFIADFSHELKTPLTGIIGAAEMMEPSPLTSMVTREAKRLDRLARQILALSRLEATGVSSGGATREELIEEAIANLVENAKKHSGSDEITVREEEKDGYHRWIVEDRGTGVPEEFREKIFERFYRLDSSRSSASGGTGLGLAIVRRIARNLGGDCVCESAEPKGARFIFSIPSFPSEPPP